MRFAWIIPLLAALAITAMFTYAAVIDGFPAEHAGDIVWTAACGLLCYGLTVWLWSIGRSW